MRGALIGLALIAPLVAACGFEPLYADHTHPVTSADLAAVKIAPIPEHIGQLLQWQLEREFNPDGIDAEQHYTLHVAMSIRTDYLAIEPNNVAPRASVSAAADMALTTMDSKTVLYRSKIQSIVDYNVGTNPYSAEIGKSGAEQRVVDELGEQIALRLATYFHNKSATQ